VPEVSGVEANAGVLGYLAQGGEPGEVPVVRPGPETDTWRLGAHPDIVAHLWERLNAVLEGDGRFLLADTAALVDPDSGLVLAVALGTQYALQLSGEGLLVALEAEHETSHEFATVGRTLDLTATFGPGWVFGHYDSREPEWLRETAATMRR
jgi:hypothetical protein